MYDDQVEIPRFKVCKKTSRKHLNPNSMILLGVTSRSGVSGVEETGPPGSDTSRVRSIGWARRSYLIVGAGREGGLGGSEALLYVNGKAVQGLDAHHREACLLPEHIESGRLSIAIKAFSGLQDEKRVFRTARLSIHEDAEDFFFRASTVLMAIETLPESDYDRQNLVRFLNEAINTLDFRKPGSEQFYSSVARANDLLKARLLAYACKREQTYHNCGWTLTYRCSVALAVEAHKGEMLTDVLYSQSSHEAVPRVCVLAEHAAALRVYRRGLSGDLC